MARCTGRRHRWLSAALLVGAAGAAAAQAPTAAPTVRAAAPSPAPKGKPVPAAKAPPPHAPAAELLDWLGRYGEAGDGLDPLGLADLETVTHGADAKKERQP